MPRFKSAAITRIVLHEGGPGRRRGTHIPWSAKVYDENGHLRSGFAGTREYVEKKLVEYFPDVPIEIKPAATLPSPKRDLSRQRRDPFEPLTAERAKELRQMVRRGERMHIGRDPASGGTSPYRGPVSEEIGSYSEYSPAHERALKEESKGLRSVRIDKIKGRWVIRGVRTEQRDPSPTRERFERGGLKNYKHLDHDHYYVTDAEAGRLAKAVNARLPKHGMELHIELPAHFRPHGKIPTAWLKRTPLHHIGAPKRGWVWSVFPRDDFSSRMLGGR